MALNILAPVAELVGNIVLAIQNWKQRGPFPTVAFFVVGLVFLLCGGISALALIGLSPIRNPLAIVFAVTFGSIALPIGAKKAGLKIGFLLTPVSSLGLGAFAAVGSWGALHVADAL